MNLRTTTPASHSRKARTFAKRFFTIVVAVLFMVAGTLMYYNAQPVSADQYDEKIRALQKSMAKYQAEADKLNAKATTLANALAQLTNQKNALQAQINLSQARHDKLVIEIADTEKKIKENQDALGDTIADLYVDDEISPIEMLASSESIGDFLNKQEYRNAVKDELSSTIKTVKELKAKLTDQKKEVEKVLAEQKAARDELADKEAEQANLLAQTRNDEATYQGLIKDSKKQIAEARALQAALRARANSTGGYTLVSGGSLGAYTSLWAPNSCWMTGYLSNGGADGNGGDGQGYGCRQCASYVAWRIAKETNHYYRWGNGGNFASAAINAGYQNLGRSPQPGSIAVMWGNPGHVAWVEAVSGNQVFVSQYNYDYGAGYGMYSEMWLSKDFFDQYVKII